MYNLSQMEDTTYSYIFSRSLVGRSFYPCNQGMLALKINESMAEKKRRRGASGAEHVSR